MKIVNRKRENPFSIKIVFGDGRPFFFLFLLFKSNDFFYHGIMGKMADGADRVVESFGYVAFYHLRVVKARISLQCKRELGQFPNKHLLIYSYIYFFFFTQHRKIFVLYFFSYIRREIKIKIDSGVTKDELGPRLIQKIFAAPEKGS